MTPLARIAAMLRARAGLDAGTMGPRALAHAVRGRVAACGLEGPAAYVARLAADAVEWQALLEAVVVPETWFFRDRQPFALLSEWAQRPAVGAAAILSLPCATGEEAWSIAIVLAAAGRAPASYRIDAYDLSEQALSVARAGIYPPRSLRGHRLDPEWARHLRARDDGRLEVAPELRGSVRFARGNLAEVRSLIAGRTYDAIFSRNLLIYCDAATRRSAIEAFTAALGEGGLLFLGHAETLPRATPGFVRELPLGAFCYRRSDATTTRQPQAGPAVPAEAMSRSGGADRLQRASRRPDPAGAAAPTPVRQPLARPALARARALADEGRLDEAAALARLHVERIPGDVAGRALLGVVLAAQGRDRAAAEHLRRALYLDPACEEALLHLPLVLERLGDAAAAARVRQRARRAEAAR